MIQLGGMAKLGTNPSVDPEANPTQLGVPILQLGRVQLGWYGFNLNAHFLKFSYNGIHA